MARLARILSVALITAGIVLLSDAGLTVAWQEPISAAYGSLRQSQAASQLDTVGEDFRDLPQTQRVQRAQADGQGDPNPMRLANRLANLFGDGLEDGKPIGRISIPSINADYVVIQGTGTADLQRGPGHYPETKLPGQGSTIGIAGHRTTYGAPFNRIDSIEEGDRIELDMPYGTFTYEVTGTKIVTPDQTEVVDDVGRERLVLSACHPLYSAAKRYIVFADLAEASPRAS